MSEPVPVQPATIDYAGQPAALGPPIRHPGMELRSSPAEARHVMIQVLFGAAVSFFAALAAIITILFF